MLANESTAASSDNILIILTPARAHLAWKPLGSKMNYKDECGCAAGCRHPVGFLLPAGTVLPARQIGPEPSEQPLQRSPIGNVQAVHTTSRQAIEVA